MVGYCSAFGCKTKSLKGGPSFHKFPADKCILQKWLVAIKRENFKPTKHSRLCSDHFENTDFIVRFGQKYLEKSAVPSIFNFPQHLQKRKAPVRNRNSAKRRKGSESPVPISIPSCKIPIFPENTETEPSTSETSYIFNHQLPSQLPDPVIKVPSQKPGKKRTNPTYFGDFQVEDMRDPIKAQKMFSIAQDLITQKRKTIKYLRNQNRSLIKKINMLTSM